MASADLSAGFFEVALFRISSYTLAVSNAEAVLLFFICPSSHN